MANENVAKTIYDAVDEFHLNKRFAESMTHILEDIFDEVKTDCELEVNDPHHPVSRMYACITSIQNQLNKLETIVESMPALAAAK